MGRCGHGYGRGHGRLCLARGLNYEFSNTGTRPTRAEPGVVVAVAVGVAVGVAVALVVAVVFAVVVAVGTVVAVVFAVVVAVGVVVAVVVAVGVNMTWAEATYQSMSWTGCWARSLHRKRSYSRARIRYHGPVAQVSSYSRAGLSRSNARTGRLLGLSNCSARNESSGSMPRNSVGIFGPALPAIQ